MTHFFPFFQSLVYKRSRALAFFKKFFPPALFVGCQEAQTRQHRVRMRDWEPRQPQRLANDDLSLRNGRPLSGREGGRRKKRRGAPAKTLR